MEIIKLSKRNYVTILKRTAAEIRGGKTAICPTDTVYGLLCAATNIKAVKRLLEIKNRPKGKPIPIFVKDIKMAKRLAFMDKRQEKFLRKHWPGRVTAVLRARDRLPKLLLGGTKTVGLRIPDHSLVQELLNLVKQPLTGTSANISGQPPCWSAKAVINQFKYRKHKPDLIIDAGRLPKRKPSRVIDLTVWPIKILRD